MEVDAAGLVDLPVGLTVTVVVTAMQEQKAEADEEGSAWRVEKRSLSGLHGLTVIGSSSLPQSFQLRLSHSSHPVGLAVTVTVAVAAGYFELQ